MNRFDLHITFIFTLFLLLTFSCSANQRGRVIYRNNIQYNTSHWALSNITPADPIFVARVISHEKIFIIKLNPTDARGYRIVATLEDPDMASTLNRPYTLRERLGLNAVLAACQNIYETLGLIAQIEVLGNNSQIFNLDSEETMIGNEHEPSFLHGHVIGRGSPYHEYIEGVPLRGPIPGELFELRKQKIQWIPSEMEIVRKTLSKQFWLHLLELEGFGIIVKDLAPFEDHKAMSNCSESLVKRK